MTGDGTTRWWWIRHAPVVGHKGVIYGRSDVPCDTSDTFAFKALAAALPGGAVWVVSGLSRARKTAEAIVAAGLKAPEFLVEPDLDEQFFGDWQGLRWDDFRASDDPSHKRFWENPTQTAPPGGESFAGLIQRTGGVVRRLTAEYAGRDIIAVAHGGGVGGAVAEALDLRSDRALSLQIDNLSLTRLDFIPGGGWRIVGVNLPPIGEAVP